MRFGPTISLWKNRISPKVSAVITPNHRNCVSVYLIFDVATTSFPKARDQQYVFGDTFVSQGFKHFSGKSHTRD